MRRSVETTAQFGRSMATGFRSAHCRIADVRAGMSVHRRIPDAGPTGVEGRSLTLSRRSRGCREALPCTSALARVPHRAGGQTPVYAPGYLTHLKTRGRTQRPLWAVIAYGISAPYTKHRGSLLWNTGSTGKISRGVKVGQFYSAVDTPPAIACPRWSNPTGRTTVPPTPV